MNFKEILLKFRKFRNFYFYFQFGYSNFSINCQALDFVFPTLAGINWSLNNPHFQFNLIFPLPEDIVKAKVFQKNFSKKFYKNFSKIFQKFFKNFSKIFLQNIFVPLQNKIVELFASQISSRTWRCEQFF